jgi:hypothetical protein
MTTAQLSRDAKLARLYKIVLLTATGLFAAMYLVTALPRVFYPYDLDFIEDSILMEAQRFALGLPVYVPPSSAFIPHVYMPLYMWLSGLLLKVTGMGYAPLRLLSLAATLLTASLIGYIAGRESKQPWLGWASAALYLAGYRITGFWYELARVDSLFVALSLLGLVIGIYRPARLGGAASLISAIVLALAFFTKQTALAFGACMAIYLLITAARQAWLFMLVLVGLIVGGFALINWATDGWFYYYVVTVAGADQVELGRVVHYAAFEVFGLMIGLSGLAVLAGLISLRRNGLRILEREPWLLAMGTAVVISGTARASVGGNVNNLMPVYALLCLAPALLWKIAGAEKQVRWQWLVGGAILIQLGLGVYYPPRYIPGEAMRMAGDRLVAKIKAYDGPVLVMLHPYYVWLAGKEPSAQLPTLWSLHFWLHEPLLPDFVERIQSHYYAAIISDESPTEVDPDIQALLTSYYTVAEKIDKAESPFSPVGMPVRPQVVYLPK